MGNPEEVEAGYTTTRVVAEPPPPAYSEEGSTAQPSSSQEASSYPSDIKPVLKANQRFPPSFNAYYQWKFTKTFHLGLSKDNPLYAVRTHTGWSGAPSVVLHNGPSDKDPPLAAAGNESRWSKHSVVILPPLPGSDAESSTEFMRTNVSWKTVTYPFTIEVGDENNLRREDFEWRQSRGEEIKGLDKHSRGWKLVRLGANALGPGGERGERAHGVTSDGKEVVAVWTWHSGWSVTKSFKFQFLGSGLTGELGERWEVMAVVTALRTWYLYHEGVSSNAASAAGAAGTAAAVAA